jgi:dual-specificity kinase
MVLPSQCIHLQRHFVYRNHVCMVFDLLKQSLFDFFESVHFTPFSLKQIQSFARQLVNSVSFMHSNRLIHTDLKPENIMLRSNEVTKIQMAVC